jgi:antitoxin VapB
MAFTNHMSRATTMQTATITTQGDSQSVLLPAGLHLEGSEVYVKPLGRSVLLIPKDADLWHLMAESLDQFTDDFMADRAQPTEQRREAMFE